MGAPLSVTADPDTASTETSLFDRVKPAQPDDPDRQEMTLAVSNISCGGCIPKVEQDLRTVYGVVRAEMYSVSRRAHIVWNPQQTDTERLIRDITALGWEVQPYAVRRQEMVMKQEGKRFLTQILLAAGLGMQVMMITVAMYLGDFYGMDDKIRYVLRISAICLTLPILLYSARPFITGAWSSVKRGSLNVDVPVTLALFLAFGGSVLATFWQHGEVYFESVVMFTLLLLCARYLELLSRKRGLSAVLLMEKSQPEFAMRILPDQTTEEISVDCLVPGDEVMVEPGVIIPADGEVMKGDSSVNESIVTGESLPVNKQKGDHVIAGSINVADYLRIKVDLVGESSMIGKLIRITEHAHSSKPKLARAADRIAMHFVVGLVIMALFAGLYWWFTDRSMWLPVVISTLVVACPCALSLATPTAFVAAMNNLISKGALPINSEFLEGVGDADHVIFDKTGTLTTGVLNVESTRIADDENREQVMDIAASIFRLSRHPAAKAISALSSGQPGLPGRVVNHTGGGIKTTLNDREYIAGSVSFVSKNVPSNCNDPAWFDVTAAKTVCLLARDGEVIARFEMLDQIRPEAKAIVRALRSRGIGVSLLSGDQLAAVEKVAMDLGIGDFKGRMLPQDKLAVLQMMQSAGKKVIMVGDGLNDAPVMAAADYSIAMGGGTDLTKINADVVLANNSLGTLLNLLELSQSTRRIIKQNYAWATVYNLLAIPAALFGLVPPWLAALGMSASSLFVVFNSLRLLSTQPKALEGKSQYNQLAGAIQA